MASPIKNGLLWYEQNLEKTSFSDVGRNLQREAESFSQSLFEYFKNKGMLNTMSQATVQKQTELGNYATWEKNGKRTHGLGNGGEKWQSVYF